MKAVTNTKDVKKPDLRKTIFALAIVEAIVLASAIIYVVYFK